MMFATFFSRRSQLVVSLCGLLVSLCACGTAGTRTIPLATAPATVDSTLSTGDVFDVRVFSEAELSGTYKIEADGAIDFPLAGRVIVGGKTPREIAEVIRAALVKYVRNPQVSVLVKEINSKRLTVYGQVQRPGTFPFIAAMTLSQGISLAGGFTSMAARERVRISRREGNKQIISEYDMRAIAEGRAANVFINPGDEIYVPERAF